MHQPHLPPIFFGLHASLSLSRADFNPDTAKLQTAH
jgi:hypothetical protein